MKNSRKFLGLLMIVGLLLSLFPLNTAFAGSLSSISDTLSASGTGVISRHIIGFTTVAEIPSGGKIEITFGKTGTFTDVTTIETADVSITGQGSATYTASGLDQVLTITTATAAIAASSTLGITIGDGTGTLHNVTNPAMPGTYALYITTKDASGAVLDSGYVLVNIGGGTAVAVTVKTYISVTISDQGSNGVQFGDVDPGTTYNPDVAQSTADSSTPSVTITAGSENNTSIKVQGNLNADWSGTWPAGNTYYALDAYDNTQVSYTTSPTDMKTGIAAGGTAKLWHFLTVPTDEYGGLAENTLYFQALPG